MGCGSGRWARWVAPKVGRLHCIDPSIAIDVARKNLAIWQVMQDAQRISKILCSASSLLRRFSGSILRPGWRSWARALRICHPCNVSSRSWGSL